MKLLLQVILPLTLLLTSCSPRTTQSSSATKNNPPTVMLTLTSTLLPRKTVEVVSTATVWQSKTPKASFQETMVSENTKAVFTETPFLIRTILPPTLAPTSWPVSTPTLTETVDIPRSVKYNQYWAIVEPDKAYFWFRVDPEIREWYWYSAPPNRMEYKWGVEFPALDGTYAAMVTLIISEKGLIPQKGTIEDLLKVCNSNLWLVDLNYIAQLRDEAVEARYFNNGILIELVAPSYVSSLYEKQPKTLLFDTDSYNGVIPDKKIDVSVIYR